MGTPEAHSGYQIQQKGLVKPMIECTVFFKILPLFIPDPILQSMRVLDVFFCL